MIFLQKIYLYFFLKQFLIYPPCHVCQGTSLSNICLGYGLQMLCSIEHLYCLGNIAHIHQVTINRNISGRFHESKDVIEGTNPFGGDIVNKKWSLGEEHSYHMLLFQQVGNTFEITNQAVMQQIETPPPEDFQVKISKCWEN